MHIIIIHVVIAMCMCVLSSCGRFPYQIETALVLLLSCCYMVAEVQKLDFFLYCMLDSKV